MRRAALSLALSAAVALGCPSTNSTAPTVDSNPLLSESVEVLYDGWGVPHIYAKSDGDGAYAMGYVQARDRLFEMDLLRRMARGRVSELVGRAGLATDVTFRTLFTSPQQTTSGSHRIEDVIAEQLQTVSPELAGILDRYAAGVNRFVDDLRAGRNGARLPAEYGLIGVGRADIAPWTSEDSIAFGRLVTLELSDTLLQEIDFGMLYLSLKDTTLGRATFADLTRFAPAVDSYILPGGGAVAATGAAIGFSGSAEALGGARAALARLPQFSRERAGSNNWVLSRALSDGAHALIANDPHLALTNPPQFQIVHLVTPSRDVAGVSFPGAPVLEIGHNGSIAWGVTVAEYDVTDVYAERVSGGQIVTPPGAPAPVVIQETIHVRGSSPVQLPVVLVPNHGPVLPGSTTDKTAYTVKWTGQVPSYEILSLWNLNKAKTVSEAFQAIKLLEVGAQNFVVADSAGDIGYFPHAYVPVRKCKSLLTPPWAPMPGDGSCDWNGRVPEPDDPICQGNKQACLPQALNPAQGWIATANNDITGVLARNDPLSAPAYLYAYTDLGYRHARIVERLSQKPTGWTLDDMSDIQADNLSKFAQALVPGLAAWFGSQDCGAEAGGPSCAGVLAARGLTAAATLLEGWDFSTPTGLSTSDPTSAPATDPAGSSAAAALFHVLVPRLARRILDDDLAQYQVDGAALSVDRFVGLGNDQAVAKYLAALAAYAQGGVGPRVPLYTEMLGQSLCRVRPAAGGLGTETCADMAVLALEDAVDFLSQVAVFDSPDPASWRWGRLHRVTFQNRVSEFAPPLLDYGPFAHHGGLYTVDVANFSWDDDGSAGFTSTSGFIQNEGPNVRFSAEIGASSVRWRAVIPGGQVDFPGDPHYEDQIPAWLANEKVDQPYTRAEVDANAKGRLLFTR